MDDGGVPRAPLPSPGCGAEGVAASGDGIAASLALVVAVGAAAVVYFPITRSYFHQDDFLHLQSIVNDRLLHFVLQPYAGHVCIVRNAIFALSYFLFGTHAAWWFAIVLLTHLLNVGLLVTLVGKLTDSPRLACLGGVLWGTAPMQEGTLGWYSVYGQVVAATMLLLVLVDVGRRVGRDARLGPGVLLVWGALLLLGATAFGVGAGVAGAFPIVIALCFPAAHRLRLYAFLLTPVVVGVYWADHVLVAKWFGDSSEAALQILVGLSSYWQNAAAMLPHLVAAGISGIVLGLAHPLAAYPDAAGYAVGIAFAAAFLIGAVGARPPQRRLLLALAVIALAAYGSIAAGRATLWAGFGVPAYGAGQARYHYLATIPLATILCLLLARLASTLPLPHRARTPLLVACLAGIGALYASSSWRIDSHDADRRVTAGVIAAIEDAIARVPPGAAVVLPNQRFPPAVLSYAFAGSAAVYTIFFRDDPTRRISFVEPDPAVRALARPGSRLAAVLVPPAAPPSSP